MATAVPAGSPLAGGVAQVPSPRQNVPSAASVPLLRFATAKLPVIFAAVPLALPVKAPTKLVDVTDAKPVMVVARLTSGIGPPPSVTTTVSYTHLTLPTKRIV